MYSLLSAIQLLQKFTLSSTILNTTTNTIQARLIYIFTTINITSLVSNIEATSNNIEEEEDKEDLIQKNSTISFFYKRQQLVSYINNKDNNLEAIVAILDIDIDSITYAYSTTLISNNNFYIERQQKVKQVKATKKYKKDLSFQEPSLNAPIVK